MSKSKRKNSKPKPERMFLLPHSLRQEILQLLVKAGKTYTDECQDLWTKLTMLKCHVDDTTLVWEDIHCKQYTLQDLDDRYLANIVKFIAKGGGSISFLDENKIKKLHQEAVARGIKNLPTLRQCIYAYDQKLNEWALDADITDTF